MRYLRTGGRKRDENQITAEKDLEISRLKDMIAEITQENLEIKKKIGERLQRRGKTYFTAMCYDLLIARFLDRTA